jgi:hypothetical protein
MLYYIKKYAASLLVAFLFGFTINFDVFGQDLCPEYIQTDQKPASKLVENMNFYSEKVNSETNSLVGVMFYEGHPRLGFAVMPEEKTVDSKIVQVYDFDPQNDTGVYALCEYYFTYQKVLVSLKNKNQCSVFYSGTHLVNSTLGHQIENVTCK